MRILSLGRLVFAAVVAMSLLGPANGASAKEQGDDGGGGSLQVGAVQDSRTIAIKARSSVKAIAPNVSSSVPGTTISWTVYSELGLYQTLLGTHQVGCKTGASTSQPVYDLYLELGLLKTNSFIQESGANVNWGRHNVSSYRWTSGKYGTGGTNLPNECVGQAHHARASNGSGLGTLNTNAKANW